MKRLILILIVLVLTVSIGYAKDVLTLVDNTDITDSPMLLCMRTDNHKTLILTGTAADTFVITEDGVDVVTVTLVDVIEKWTTRHKSNSFNVDMTLAGSGSAVLHCND